MEKYFNNKLISSDLKRKAIRGAGVTIFSQVVMYGIQMIGTIILARLLTPDDFGMVAMVTAFSILLQNFGLRGFTEATIQSKLIDHKKISTLFWIHVALGITITIFLICIAPLIAWFYKNPRLVSITIVISLSIIFNALSTQHLALLTRNMDFYKITAIEINATCIATIVAIIFAWHGGGYWSLVARRVVPIIAMAVGAWIMCRWLPGMPIRGTDVRKMLRFAFNTYGNFAMNYFSRNLDKVLIGWRYGAKSLGYYERAYYLFVMPVNQLSYPLTNVAVATLSKLRDDPEKYRNYYLKSISFIAFIGMPLSTILTLVGSDLLLLLLGEQWNEAGKIFTVFGPGIGILLIYGTHGWLHLSLGRADRWFRWGIIELVVTTITFLIGLRFGTIGIAVAYTACFYLLIFPGLWYAGRPIQITLISLVAAVWRHYFAALATGIICWFFLYSLNMTSNIFFELNILFRIIISLILCIFIYMLIVFTFDSGKKQIKLFLTVLYEILPIKI